MIKKKLFPYPQENLIHKENEEKTMKERRKERRKLQEK